jgi:DNA-directed RNA polymerase specialized sigma24 family protein
MTAVLEPGQLRPETVDRAAEALRVYEEERAGLVRRAVQFAGGRDQAEDAVQDAFVALLTNPEQVRNAAAYVKSHSRGWALQESSRRAKQVPVGEAMDWQPDTAPPAEDLDTLAACMGDPAVVSAVDDALARLPDQQGLAVRLHLLDGQPVSAIAKTMGIGPRDVYRRITAGLEALRAMDIELPTEEPETMAEEPAVPARKRRLAAGLPTIDDLTATLDREHPGEWLGPIPAHETLRRVHGSCSAKRAAIAQQAHNAPLTAPMRIRAGQGPEALAAANAELVVTLGREFPGRTVTNAEAEQTLRRVHGTCSLGRARQARVEHNAKVPEVVQPAKVNGSKPANRGAGAHGRGNRGDATTVALVAAEATPAPASRPAQPTTEAVDLPTPSGPTVAEVWLLGAKPPISCLLVHTDETTGSRDLAAVSMLGAQREITGQLIADGYRPDGLWVDVDPTGPEAMRKFLAAP